MNDTDLSDEAFWSCTDGMTRLQAWQECRRRAQIRIHALESQFINVCTWGEEQLEKERREAFEAGMREMSDHPLKDEWIEEGYRAFLQEREGK